MQGWFVITPEMPLFTSLTGFWPMNSRGSNMGNETLTFTRISWIDPSCHPFAVVAFSPGFSSWLVQSSRNELHLVNVHNYYKSINQGEIPASICVLDKETARGGSVLRPVWWTTPAGAAGGAVRTWAGMNTHAGVYGLNRHTHTSRNRETNQMPDLTPSRSLSSEQHRAKKRIQCRWLTA